MKSKPGTSSTVHHDLEAGLPQARYSQSLKTPSTATATSIATDNPQATEDQVLLTSSSTAKTNLAPASNNQPLQAPAMDRGAPRPAGTVQTTRQRSDEIPTAGASLIIAVPAMVALIILLFGYDAKICTSTGGWMLFTLFSTSISSGLTAALISSCSDPDTKKLRLVCTSLRSSGHLTTKRDWRKHNYQHGVLDIITKISMMLPGWNARLQSHILREDPDDCDFE